MNAFQRLVPVIASALLLGACGGDSMQPIGAGDAAMDEAAEERGPNNGRMLRDGDFAVELAIFEAGTPPEFRAWATAADEPLDPSGVSLSVRLTRLGGIDEIGFAAERDYLRGDTIVYEPHSFVVGVNAQYAGRTHRWEYESFEGRTGIPDEMAAALGIETEIAGPALLDETLTVYGTIVPNADRVREVSARFDGAIVSVDVALGQTVSRGQPLARVESNESLQVFAIDAPIDGVVVERAASPGEQTAGRQLFTIVDLSTVWAELAIFPADRARVRTGMSVTIAPATGGAGRTGTISYIGVLAGASQAVTARVELDNSDGAWALGTYVEGTVAVAQYEVPLAIRRSGLQSFRDFTVVYAKFDEEYEVRMLDLGREAGDWIEVLGGLEPGTEYVTENSYVLKADVEKSGAAHDH